MRPAAALRDLFGKGALDLRQFRNLGPHIVRVLFGKRLIRDASQFFTRGEV